MCFYILKYFSVNYNLIIVNQTYVVLNIYYLDLNVFKLICFVLNATYFLIQQRVFNCTISVGNGLKMSLKRSINLI